MGVGGGGCYEHGVFETLRLVKRDRVLYEGLLRDFRSR